MEQLAFWGSVASITGLSIKVIFELFNNKGKIPCYAIHSLTWPDRERIDPELSNIKIIHSDPHLKQDREIKRSTITEVAFWNAGKETIESKDIVHKNPLRIVVNENVKILESPNKSKIIQPENLDNCDNKFEIPRDKHDPNLIYIKFDHIAENEGLIIKIIHDGFPEDIELQGRISGCKKIENIEWKKIKNGRKKKIKKKSFFRNKTINSTKVYKRQVDLGILVIVNSFLIIMRFALLIIDGIQSNEIQYIVCLTILNFVLLLVAASLRKIVTKINLMPDRISVKYFK